MGRDEVEKENPERIIQKGKKQMQEWLTPCNRAEKLPSLRSSNLPFAKQHPEKK